MASQRLTKKDTLTLAESAGALQAGVRRRSPGAKRARRGAIALAPTVLERLRSVVGKAKGLPPDASVNHDYYLYGLPRK